MAERYRSSRSAARRQPLTELKNKANTPPVSQQQARHSKLDTSSHPSLPHNESLEANGTLTVRSHERPYSPENKRVSQIASEYERDSKRNSAISTTSTNASTRKRKAFIGHWQLGKTIGKGGCSRVRIVRHRYRDQLGAVKIITRSTAESTRAQSLANLIESTKGSSAVSPAGYKPIPYGLEREIAVMKLLEHPNIVRLYDVWENRNELYLIMEFVDGGELFHYVDERKGLPEDETVLIFRQIVSALLYCHRLLICHRDLKPENILLNKQDLTVKLIDFGMAALQPQGRLLSTPCGSPHYAAPEVVSSKQYDGHQADVWSCGVILYVMLTGTTPYNYDASGEIKGLFRDITAANYYMPEGLSHEARDLIRRIFVPNPKKRITMDEVWDHPLLHKYDRNFGFTGEYGTKEAAVGDPPKLDEWRVHRIQDIDREILRNMRTLWHSEPEQSLIQKLLNNEYNQEKLFYAALIKHREENLENYIGEPDDIGYSASDYHHSHPLRGDDPPPLPTAAQRSESKYSIMNDEHLRPSHSFVAPPPSVSSYDPYRASRDPIVNSNGEYVNIKVHRTATSSTRRASVGRNLRHPNSTRIETLKHAHRRQSVNASSSSLPRSGRSRSTLPRSSMSRHSLTSTLLPSSPPVPITMRPSDVHKRGVSFGHIRRVSTASALTSQMSSTNASTPATPSLPVHLRDHQARVKAQARHHAEDSPTAHVDQPIKSRKERSNKLETPRIKVRKPVDTPGDHIRSQIRKHSAELEKACEEAFFRDSYNSSTTARTSLTDKPSPYDTPPSSIAAHPSDTTPGLPSATKPTPRPLPNTPKDTPNSYLTRTLEETKHKLATYRGSGEDNTARIEEVMKMLDNIMPTAGPGSERRIASAPEAAKQSEQNGFLPIISEESSDPRSSKEGNWHRSVTAPVAKERNPEDHTIRVVPPSSPGTVAPLNVRKRSSGNQLNKDVQRRPTTKASSDTLRRKHAVAADVSALESIDEDTTLTTPTLVRKKRSGWFGRIKRDVEEDGHPGRPTSKAARSILTTSDETDARRRSTLLTKDSPNSKSLPDEPPLSAQSSEFPIRKHRFGNSKKGFSKWLGRMGREKGDDTTMITEPDTTTMLTNQSLDSLFSSTSPAPSSNDSPPTAGPERSWFARFFNIKPVVDVLCFTIPRGRARQELVVLFKEWQRHGIRDLEYSRETNTITARVDKVNTLNIKPVTFRVELFIVLERGQKVGLSIARFVQVKGAASGFRQVLDVVDGVMRSRGWLVEDEEKWRALTEVVSGY
ncbi:putative serine/threonine-protein kinase HSL1 [Pseudocercospora fuligena]|uniref:non-specific serine/threonine protein kinase n=1 Tax=Pseudocercospora fuligena TaxID=685502 RepID=A0A8H6RAE8_9PEZI|nr:putative serine/threonine-protein kinase HSL1 [Pseudocercospora fuligena]